MRIRRPLLLLLTFAISACATGPTGEDIENSLEAQLRSVAGAWTGSSPQLSLSFQLAESGSGQLTGTGTMTETGVTGSVPITVTGSYQRPQLVLVFTGMRRNSQQVRGDASGQYTSVGGVSTALVLTGVNGSNYSEQISILLQEVQ